MVQLIFDGTTAYLQGNLQLWSIVARVMEIHSSLVFTVRLYCGKANCSSVSDFLNKCISELNVVMKNKTQVSTKSVRCIFSSVISHTPAQDLIRQANRTRGCMDSERCIQRGLYRGKRVIATYIKCKAGEGTPFCAQ